MSSQGSPRPQPGQPRERGRGWMALASVTGGIGLQRGLGALLPLILAAVATRSGGFEVAGVVGVAAASTMLLAVAVDFGISQAAVRDFAVEPPGRREFYGLLQFRIAVGAVAAAILAGAAFLAGSDEWTNALMVAALTVPAYSATLLLSGKHTADGNGTTLGLGAIFGFAAGTLTALTVSALTDEAWALLTAVVVARITEAGLLFFGLQLPRFATKGLYGPRWVVAAWPLWLVAFLQMAYLRGQVIIPAAILDTEGAGQVVDGFALYSAATLVAGALSFAAWPALSRAAAESSRGAYRLALRFGLVNLTVAGVPVALLLIAPGWLSELIFGETTADLETYVRWGAVGTLLVAVNGIMSSLALSIGRDRLVAFTWVAGLAASAVLTAVLTDAYGVPGAGEAVAASELVIFLLLAWTISPAARASILRDHRVLAAGGGILAAAGAVLLAWASGSSPAVGFLPLLALPVFVALVVRYSGYPLLAPATIFSLSWTSALAIAQLPLFPSFEWNREAWLLMILPPAALTAAAVVGAGRVAFERAPAASLMNRPPVGMQLTLVAACIGAIGWGLFFVQIGTIPLLSDQIDIVRFTPFSLPTLLATRFGYVAVIVSIPGVVLAATRRERFGFMAAFAIALVPMLLSGGRLYPFSAVVVGVVAVILVRTLTVRLGLLSLLGAALLLTSASMVFFVRIEQQTDTGNEFKQHLDRELRDSRPDVLAWTIPIQMAASSSMYTLADLAATRSHEMDAAPGLYSTKFVDRLRLSGDLELVARTTARFGLITTTYVGPWYADFGLQGAITLSLAWGMAAGLVWRWWRVRPGPLNWLLYAYSAFWLMYAIYLNYWVIHGVWLADVALFAIFTARSRAGRAWLLGLARRYEDASGPGPEEPEARPRTVPRRATQPDTSGGT